MKIAIGNDHAGVEVKKNIEKIILRDPKCLILTCWRPCWGCVSRSVSPSSRPRLVSRPAAAVTQAAHASSLVVPYVLAQTLLLCVVSVCRVERAKLEKETCVLCCGYSPTTEAATVVHQRRANTESFISQQWTNKIDIIKKKLKL